MPTCRDRSCERLTDKFKMVGSAFVVFEGHVYSEMTLSYSIKKKTGGEETVWTFLILQHFTASINKLRCKFTTTKLSELTINLNINSITHLPVESVDVITQINIRPDRAPISLNKKFSRSRQLSVTDVYCRNTLEYRLQQTCTTTTPLENVWTATTSLKNVWTAITTLKNVWTATLSLNYSWSMPFYRWTAIP